MSAAVWRYVERLKGRIRVLERQVATLQGQQAARPSPRVSFEFDPTAREALLHVTNDGGDAEMRGRLSIEGALTNRVGAEADAMWMESGSSRLVVRRGETRTLRLAKLDLSVFPYAQWEIYTAGPSATFAPGATVAREGGHYVERAMHTSMIGGDPETHAPTIFLQVALVTSPDSASPPPHCTIALQPFEAVRLRPL